MAAESAEEQPEYWADRLLGAVREASRPRLKDCSTSLVAGGTWQSSRLLLLN
jgi:hypothetical protein